MRSTGRSGGAARTAVTVLGVGAAIGCVAPAGASAATDGGPAATAITPRRAPVAADGGATTTARAPDAPGGPSAVTVRAPSLRHGAWVAKILQPTRARPAPGSPKRGVPVGTTVSGGHAQELLVLDRQTRPNGEGWLRVRLPSRPNDAAGWIPEDAARLRRTPWWVRVRTEKRTITVYQGGRRRWQARTVVGARATPTPRGLFAVLLAAKQRDPRGFLGPWALHLTSHSDVLEDFGGGPGRVAIHGRDGASLHDPLGSARSHGCVRVSNASVTKLAGWLRPGTPVQITR